MPRLDSQSLQLSNSHHLRLFSMNCQPGTHRFNYVNKGMSPFPNGAFSCTQITMYNSGAKRVFIKGNLPIDKDGFTYVNDNNNAEWASFMIVGW